MLIDSSENKKVSNKGIIINKSIPQTSNFFHNYLINNNSSFEPVIKKRYQIKSLIFRGDDKIKNNFQNQSEILYLFLI